MPEPIANLTDRLPPPDEVDADSLLDAFLEWVDDQGIELYPAQEEAVLELMGGSHVILETPTGSGKSLVATALHFRALALGERSFYTAPIKALVNEKFLALCNDFGPANVGMMTGDGAVNRDAPIVACTAEILANLALREGDAAVVDQVVMDEFHYYADPERGVAWQVPLLLLPDVTFLLMSATLGDTSEIEQSIARSTGRLVARVESRDRPVPLAFAYRDTPLHETVGALVEADRAPIYQVNFTQRECAEQAQNLMSTNYSTKEDKRRLAAAAAEMRFDSPYGKDVRRFLLHGIGLHHGGLLPKYRLLVERLARAGLLKVICGTDTLGVGVNVPIRTVLFTKLCKFDGAKVRILTVREFQQISGRAGRKGFDEQGYVVAQAPEHVIENLRLEAKARGMAPGKAKKLVKRKPPTKGFVRWDKGTFRRLCDGRPEPLESRFTIDHGMLLNVLHSDDAAELHGGGYRTLVDLIERCHERPAVKSRLRRRARQLFRSLREAEIVRLVRRPGGPGRDVEVDGDLQEDFSLFQTLALFLSEALPVLEPEEDDYALDVVSFVESILEQPRVLLLRQLDRLKAEGVPYEERMEALEQVERPKPCGELIYALFDEFERHHPWVGQDNVHPKSIVRELVEGFFTFDDYVLHLGLQRAEGVLLRYLSMAFKTLVQSVPEALKTDDVLDVIALLRTTLARVDSSLIEEWERLLHGREGDHRAESTKPLDISADPRTFAALVRAELHRLVQALARKAYEEAVACVRPAEEQPWTPERFEAELAPYYEEYDRIVFDHSARLSHHTHLEPDGPHRWRVAQTLVDPEADGTWSLRGVVDLSEDTAPAGPLVELIAVAG